MASGDVRLRLAAVLLVVLFLGNECGGVSAKRNKRKDKNGTDQGQGSSDKINIEPPTDLKIDVLCNNTVHATWKYESPQYISGFLVTLCNTEEHVCSDETLTSDVRQFWSPLAAHNSGYKLSVFTTLSTDRSEPAQASFNSYPDLAKVEDLTVTATSPTELRVQWRSEWQHDIKLSACSETARCVNVTAPAQNRTQTLKGLEPSTAYDVNAQTAITMNNRTCEGPAAKKSASTLQLAPPSDLKVEVLCENKAHVTWAYDHPEWITGFVARLCDATGLKCKNETILKSSLGCSFTLPEYNVTYKVSVWSYYQSPATKHEDYSAPAETSLTSYPKLPELDDIAVTGVNTTALVATWTTEWHGPIAFTVCSAPKACKNHTVPGWLRNHTFGGLSSNTTYRIRAQAEVTLNNKTCRGHLQERSASTFVERPGIVRNVHHTVENGTILQASWEAPAGSEVSGYTIMCKDPKTNYTESQDFHGGKPPNQITLVLRELVASFNCSVFAYNINATRDRVNGPPFTFSASTDGIASPKNLTLVERNATSFTFSWSADPNATKWEIVATPEGQLGQEQESSGEYDAPHNGTVTHAVTGLLPSPSEVRNFNYSVQKDVSVLLTWEKPDHPNGPLDSYVIRVYNEDRNETNNTEVPGDRSEVQMNLKHEFNLFNVSISAYNKATSTNQTFYSPESELSFETLGKGPVPPRPKTQDVKEKSVHLSWEEPHDPRYNITGFSIKVGEQPSYETNQSSITIENLEPWKEYNVSVASCTSKTSCGQSRSLAFKTDFAAPSEPLDLKAPEAGTHWMLVHWEKPKVLNGPLSGYNVSFSHGDSHRHAVTTDLHYNCTELVPGTSYDVSVYAFNEVKSVTKRGPPTSLQATTQAETPAGQGVSTGDDSLGGCHSAHSHYCRRFLLPLQEVPEEDRGTHTSQKPLQISGLEATVHGGNRATVKWENATGPVTGYNMTVCLVTDSPRCESVKSQKTNYVLHHLASGTTYQVDVHAYVEEGGDTTKGRSERIFFTTTKLPTVEQLEATPLGSTSVELKWLPSQDAVSHFDIDACPSDGGACVHAYTPNVTHILEGLTPDTTYKIEVRSAVEEEKELSFGPASAVSATTTLLPAITDVVVRATCDSFIVASWNYSVEGITGFLLNLCAEGQSCITRSVDKDDREHTFRVDAILRSYTLSIEAYLWKGNAKRSSPAVNESVTSFPEVPRLDRFEVEAISPSQIRAKWSNSFDVDVRIQVCVAQSARKNCVNYAAHGTQLGYTVSGLSPSTKYTVEASTAITLGVDTCLGLGSTREVTTLTEDPYGIRFLAVESEGIPFDVIMLLGLHNLCGVMLTRWVECGKLPTLLHFIGHDQWEQFAATFGTPAGTPVAAYVDDSVSSGYSDHADIGPVQELSYHIVNITTLNATWKRPVTKEDIAGYTLECTILERHSSRKINVFPASEIVQASLELEDQVQPFECKVPHGRQIGHTRSTLPICLFGGLNQHCQNYNVSGALHQATFTGLLPETTYNVKSNGQVTYGNRTCIGPETEQAASTYSLNPGPVSALKYEIDNVTILAANWDGPLASVDYDGYVLHCVEHGFRAVRTVEVPEAEKHVNITLDLEEQLATFDCNVWAFAYNGTKRNNGTISTFSVTTNGIGPPENVTLVERTTTSLAYSWPKDPKAPNCRVRVLAAYVTEVYKNDCTSISDKDLLHYNVTNLTPGQRYNVSIQNCADYCGLAKVVGDYTNVAAPSEVRNFSASVSDFVNVTFKWEKPARPNGPIDGYLIHVVKEDSNVTTEILADGVTTNVTVVVGSEFSYFHCAIKAYNIRKPEQEKLFGPEISTTFESLGDGPFPPHPTIRDIQETDASVYWEKAEDPRYNITSYRISVEPKGTFPTTDTKFNLSHLHPWTKYVVSVSSCTHETGCGEARSISFKTDVSAPSKPVWLSTRSVGAEWIYLEWERPKVPNGPIDGFNVSLVGRNVSFEAVTTGLSYNATQLSPGFLYRVSVYAFNYGFHKEKRGPSATLTVSTLNDAKSTSSLFLIIGVVSFFITSCAVAVYFLCQQSKPDISEEDETELHTMKPWLRISRKLCPNAVFGQDEQDDHLVTQVDDFTFEVQKDRCEGSSTGHESRVDERAFFRLIFSFLYHCFVSGLPSAHIMNGVNIPWRRHDCDILSHIFGVLPEVRNATCSIFIAQFASSVCNFLFLIDYSQDGGTVSCYSPAGPKPKGNENPSGRKPETPAAPTNVYASATCDNHVVITWSYSDEPATSFWLQMCMTGITTCQRANVDKDTRTFTFRVGPTENTYEVSIWASNETSTHAVNSTCVTVNVTTFPYVPLMDSVAVSAVTASALRITWTVEWKYKLRLSVCPFEGLKERCNEHFVDGLAHVYTISGLNASTLYQVDTTAQVTRYGLTCTGPVFEQDVMTFPSDIGPVQNLNYKVINVTVISACWDEPSEAREVDGYTMTCRSNASGQSTTAEYLHSGNVSFLLDVKEQLANFSCAVNAFATRESGRQEGLPTVFEVATHGIAAPRQVTLMNATKTSLTYSWLVDPSAKKCRIQVKALSPNYTAANITHWLSEVVDSRFVKRTVLRLSPGTLYEICIQNCAGYCGLSTVVRSMTEVDAPSPVWQLHSNLKGFSDVLLTWARPQKPNGPIDGYTIQLFNKNTNETYIQTVDGESLNLSVHLRNQFTHFKASVSAYNIDHAHNVTLQGVAENTDFITLGEGPFPPLPKVETVEERQATLYWKTPHDPRYNITQFCVSVIGTTCSFISDNHYVLDKLLPYQEYTVNVSSCNSTRCGQARSVHFVTDVGVPSLPRSLTIELLGTSWIEVQWRNPQTPCGPISGYTITWSNGKEGIMATTNETMFNVTSLKSGTFYSISVYAFNDGHQQRKRGPATLVNVSTLSDRTPLEGTSTFTIAIVVTTLCVVTLVASVYITFLKRRQRKLAHTVEEFDCHPLVSEETLPSPRKHILNCFSSSV
ncbi:uncharacterized protein LOC119464246 [Dermacentor silvarum]|uniref:uncharacterized protein LOC119464246 n=1 Tax=Dermacentor silvarum TaxID=543639 RepID=UPI0021009D98|nr:uncharacterized protein LOC119464246 [Dermacentor silvarum]